jgi:hypothetical protein
MRIDQDHTASFGASRSAIGAHGAGLHQVMHQLQEQARLASPGLGNREQVATQQSGRQMNRNRLALVGGDPNATAGTICASGRDRAR